MWRGEKIQVVISLEIIAEYRHVGEIFAQERPGIDLSKILDYVYQNEEFFKAPSLPESVCVDLDDAKFLACASASGSRLLISGDKHLLNVSEYKEVEVLKPRTFLEKYIY